MREYTRFPGTPCTYHGRVGLPVEPVSPEEFERRRQAFQSLKKRPAPPPPIAPERTLRVLVAPSLLRKAKRCQHSTKRCHWLESGPNARKKCGWYGDDVPYAYRCTDCLDEPAPAKDEVE